MISRAQNYASIRLREQVSIYEEYERKVSFWLTIILVISFCLFSIGIISTLAENRSKRKLKLLHESILSKSDIGICVFEVLNEESKDRSLPVFRVVFRNYGALIKNANTNEDQFINLDSLPQDLEFANIIKVVAITGQSIVKEKKYEVSDEQFWFLISLSKESVNHVAFYYQDITRIKRYEAELKSKAGELETVNRDLEQFAHATSHDLQEPFRKIQIMTDIIMTNRKMENNVRYLEAIKRASDKGSKLVAAILDYSKT